MHKLFSTQRVLTHVEARCFKHGLALLAAHVASEFPEIDERLLVDSLIERENLGSTLLRRGVSFPHIALEGLQTPAFYLAKLNVPVLHEEENEEISFIALLVAPKGDEDNMGLLTKIQTGLSTDALLDQLCVLNSPQKIATLFEHFYTTDRILEAVA